MLEKIEAIINKLRNQKDLVPINELSLNMNLRSDLGLDSLDLAELTVRIENEFGIDVFEDGIVETIDEIIRKIESK